MQVIHTFNTGKVYYCVKLHPDDNKQNVLMAGCADKKIYQWDINSGDLVQEYNYHLGAVNTVTFFDEGRRWAAPLAAGCCVRWWQGVQCIGPQ